MKLHRPYIRKSVRLEIEARAPKNELGQFIDPNTNQPILGKYDLGHKSGHEFRSMIQWAEATGMTQKELNEFANNPDFYQIEDPHSNRSHGYEQATWTMGDMFADSSQFSSAELAYESQGGQGYPGRDTWQNGVVPKGQDTTFYFARFSDDQPSSGFLTDKATIDSCTHDGMVNANELADRLQMGPSNRDNPDVYQQRPQVAAMSVDWDRLESVKESDPVLYNALTDDNGNLRCAFGKAEANPQFGEGGGNQYYIDPDVLQDAVDAGVFREDPDKSFRESDGNLAREDIPNTRDYQDGVDDKQAQTAAAERAKDIPSTAELDSRQVRQDPDMPYLAQPDPAYAPDRTAAPEEKAPKKADEEALETEDPNKNTTLTEPPQDKNHSENPENTEKPVDSENNKKTDTPEIKDDPGKTAETPVTKDDPSQKPEKPEDKNTANSETPEPKQEAAVPNEADQKASPKEEGIPVANPSNQETEKANPNQGMPTTSPDPDNRSVREPTSSSGMPDQNPGKNRENTPDSMPTTAPENDKNPRSAGASDGMATTAPSKENQTNTPSQDMGTTNPFAAPSSSPEPSSAGQAQQSGQGVSM